MKIAIYISPAHAVPPETKEILAPWWLVGNIAHGLVKKGHDVTLFAAAGSKTKAKLIDLGIEPFGYKDKEMTQKEFNKYATFWEQRLASKMYQMSQEGAFEIIESHLVAKILHFAPLTKVPTIFTLHDPVNPELLDLYKLYLSDKQISYISISKSQQQGLPLPFAGNIYHGLNIDEFSFESVGGNGMLVVGRIVNEKGISEAITVARRTGKELSICGENYIDNPVTLEYWESMVYPAIDGKRIKYNGLLSRLEMQKKYKEAKILLFPIKWEEPFGLVMIEAMACGTPVVAFARGSVPEVVKDGVTGFIVNSSEEDKRGEWVVKKTGIEGLCEAVERIYAMPPEEYRQMRRNCRKHVEDNFTVEKMVDGYEEVYKKILANNSSAGVYVNNIQENTQNKLTTGKKKLFGLFG